MPAGHLPVRSYLAVPVKASGGEVLGGLFFGHSQPGVFTEQHERLAVGIASWAAVALENARLYVAARKPNRLKDRVPGRALARAAHAAERDPRLRAAAARRRARRREGRTRAGDARAQRIVADADRRRRARRLADRRPGRSGWTCSRWNCRSSCTTRSQPCSRPPTRRACACRRSSIPALARSPAIPSGCSRWCGTCCPTP